MRLYSYGHCVSIIRWDWTNWSLVSCRNLSICFFMSHCALPITLIIGHEGTLMKGDSFSNEGSFQILCLPTLVSFICADKCLISLSRLALCTAWIANVLPLTTVVDWPYTILHRSVLWCVSRWLLLLVLLLLGLLVMWGAFSDEDVIAFLLTSIA